MTLSLTIFWILFFLLLPAGVIWLCRKVEFFGKIGEILTLYIIGILVGNLLIAPFSEISSKLYPIQDGLTSITIPLAMPLILFGCNIKTLPIKSVLSSLIIGILAVVLAVISGYYIIGMLGEIPRLDKIGGMLVGVYTGGTPNLASLKMMLEVDNQTYLMINSFDMVVSFAYLVTLISFGIKWCRRFIGEKGGTKYPLDSTTEIDSPSQESSYSEIFSKENRKGTIKALLLSIIIVIIGLGISFLLTGKIDMLVLILSLTTLAICTSLSGLVDKSKKSYDAGMYLVLIFSLTVASMVDISKIDFSQGFLITIYITYAIIGSLLIQIIFAKIFKIDADTTIICSVALINSPLFVPMIAQSMKNKDVIISGITIGIIGYAIGNYLGVAIAGIL